MAPPRAAAEGSVGDVKANAPNSKGTQVDVAVLSKIDPGIEKKKVSKVARLPRVIELTGLGRSSIYNRMDSRSRYYDPTFPRCFSLSTSENGAVGWDEEQVCAWVTAQAASAPGEN
ncbi:AlpA family phage regulatory protein [Burkholderia sp. Ac-20345]|nr:AlpA family phage regulatory protein [Burkholderia sp. Ac-20345]